MVEQTHNPMDNSGCLEKFTLIISAIILLAPIAASIWGEYDPETSETVIDILSAPN